MKVVSNYHSYLTDMEDVEGEIIYFENGKHILFYHNVEWGVNPLFYLVDVVYSEISWERGYDVFLERANEKGDFDKYIHGIKEIITKLNKPTFILASKNTLKKLNPKYTVEVKLHNYPSLIGVFNEDYINFSIVKTNFEFISKLGETYKGKKLLDFSCGYGNTIKYFDGSTICSDINRKALKYAIKHVCGVNIKEEVHYLDYSLYEKYKQYICERRDKLCQRILKKY